MLIKANPDKQGTVNAGLACGKGKWGFDCSMLEDKLEEPLIKAGDDLGAGITEALSYLSQKMPVRRAKCTKDAIGVAISDEQMKKLTLSRDGGEAGRKGVLHERQKESGIAEVIGFDAP